MLMAAAAAALLLGFEAPASSSWAAYAAAISDCHAEHAAKPFTFLARTQQADEAPGPQNFRKAIFAATRRYLAMQVSRYFIYD